METSVVNLSIVRCCRVRVLWSVLGEQPDQISGALMRSSALLLWLCEFYFPEPQADLWFTCEEPSLPDTLSLLHYCGS